MPRPIPDYEKAEKFFENFVFNPTGTKNGIQVGNEIVPKK
jgi:hypothetical protein